MEGQIKRFIENELQRRNKSIRNNNAIDKFLEAFVPGGLVLKDILTGSKKAIEYEKQIITIDTILDLVIRIDKKLSQSRTGKRIGVLNTGKSNSYIGCDFVDLDIGVQDEGIDTLIKDCDFH